MTGNEAVAGAESWRLRLDAGPEELGSCLEFLEEVADAVSWLAPEGGGPVPVDAYLNMAPGPVVEGLRARFPAMAPPRLEPLPATDWLAVNRQALNPLRVGRLFIHGSHHHGPPPPGTIPIRLDAATAFGSGAHPSTAGCLLALQALARRGLLRRPLDMGCGSGILAISMAKLGAAGVGAVDSDPEAVRVGRANAKRNGVGRRIQFARADGFKSRRVRREAPYGIVAANILARPLRVMAPMVARNLAPAGRVVLSGLVVRDLASLLAAYRHVGLHLETAWTIDGWATPVLRRAAIHAKDCSSR